MSILTRTCNCYDQRAEGELCPVHEMTDQQWRHAVARAWDDAEVKVLDDYDPDYGDTDDGAWIGALFGIVCLLGAAAVIAWKVWKWSCF